MKPRALLAAALTLIFCTLAAPLTAGAAAPPSCQYTLGFKAFHDANAAVVGECTSNEQPGGGGTRVQYTTNGLLVWRPEDNSVAFTNGAQTWLQGPFGTQSRSNDTHFAWEPKNADTDTSVKGIYVVLHLQRLVAYEDGKVVVDTPITSGGPRTLTPTGTFAVIGKRSHFVMKSPWPQDDPRWYPDSWVNYALLFESSGYFIHDAPWRSTYGPGTNLTYNPEAGWVGTHGCVNVPYQAEQTLFNWADVGTTVTILA